MATSCEIEYSSEELKEVWYYSISIPYEVNHDFLLAAKLLAQEWKIPWVDEVIYFPDYGSWKKYEPHEIKVLLWKIEELEKNIEIISQTVPIPTMVGIADWRVIVGYESHRKYDSSSEKWINVEPYSTYVELWKDGYVNCEEKDIIYIFSLIRTLALKAKQLNKALRFIGE